MRSWLAWPGMMGKRDSRATGTVLIQAVPSRSVRRGGQATVELALILPVFLLLVMGVLDLGRVFYTYEAIANAAREVARQCALTKNMSTSQMGTAATNETGGAITITASSTPACDSSHQHRQRQFDHDHRVGVNDGVAVTVRQ
jgi:Flp pilus assembly protein TadG